MGTIDLGRALDRTLWTLWLGSLERRGAAGLERGDLCEQIFHQHRSFDLCLFLAGANLSCHGIDRECLERLLAHGRVFLHGISQHLASRQRPLPEDFSHL